MVTFSRSSSELAKVKLESLRTRRYRKRQRCSDVERVYDLVLRDSLRTLLIADRRFKAPDLPESEAEPLWRAAVAEVAAKVLIDYFVLRVDKPRPRR